MFALGDTISESGKVCSGSHVGVYEDNDKRWQHGEVWQRVYHEVQEQMVDTLGNKHQTYKLKPLKSISMKEDMYS